MNKFLFVSTLDIRRNTSSNIRLVALMKALHDVGHQVHCITIPSVKPPDTELLDAVSCIDKIISFPKIDSIQFFSTSGRGDAANDKKNGFRRRLRLGLIRLYTCLTVYDVYELLLKKLRLSHLTELDDDYDYIISSSEPRSSHKFAHKIIQLKGYSTKWILYWGDPMTNDLTSKRLFPARERKEEHKLLKMAYLSLYTNKCAVKHMIRKYPDCKNKIDWIPTSDISKHSQTSSSGKEEYVGYFGDYSPTSRNILPFYEACVENGIKAIIAGSGGDLTIHSTRTVVVKGRISRAEVNELEKKCKLLVVIENKTSDGECIQIPGKLYHYGLTFKPVMVITESSNLSKDYVCYNRFHFVPNDKYNIKKVITQIIDNKWNDVSNSPLKAFMPEEIVKRLEILTQNV